LLLVILVGVGGWYWLFDRDTSADRRLEASGTIEAVEVLIAPEQPGRVAQVMVEKGQSVQANEEVLRLDDVLLQSQHQRALTALENANSNLLTAQTGLDLANASLRAAETNIEAVNASTEVELLSAHQALDELYENHAVAKGEALRAAAAANRAVREAQYQLDNYTVPTNQQDYTAMEAVIVMKERLDAARDRFEPYKYKSSSDPTREDLKEGLEDAQSDYDSAIRRLEYETELEKALANQDKALQDLAELEDGPDPDKVALLEAQITAIKVAPKQAEDAALQAEVGVEQAQARLKQAQTSVTQAQAEMDLIEVQMGKLVVHAPISGVVISRNIEPGEVIQPGAPVMTIGQLEDLKITVYVPEDRYGRIKLGQDAGVTVDSFPGEVFNGTVVYISDQGEFTPRNVQTQEGRRSTVFAVELSIRNEDGKLKPGMPADVVFED
jgi:multidrug resistance efflux pump